MQIRARVLELFVSDFYEGEATSSVFFFLLLAM